MATQTKRPKPVIINTPPGTAIFPYLNEPDRGQYSKSKEFGTWKTGLRLLLADPAVAAFIATLEAAYQAAVAAKQAEETPKQTAEREASGKPLGATRPFKNEFDDAGKPTGYVTLNFKRAAGGRDPKDPSRTWLTPIGLFDSANQPIDRAKTRIGGGSRIIVAYAVDPFDAEIGAGVSLKLHAVQVLERADGFTKDAVQYGFQAQAGGFVDDTGDETPDADDTGATTGAVAATDDEV